MKRWFFIKLTTMKKLIITSILAVLVAFGTTVMAQDYPDEYLGLPGDNLNLYAVMKLFQESETLEGFERSLNAEDSRINNLDLNGDNYVDYITVSDYVDGDVHTIVLRSVLDQKEYQDVAVFTVQRFSNGSVQIQLVGDEALYGSNYIIEPYYEETPNPGYTGNQTVVNVTVVRTTPHQIATWPVIRFIYLPNYVVWRSSWYWGFYPRYWNPWRSYYWHYYYGYHYNWYHYYYRHYHYWDRPRYTRYNDFYYSKIRVFSPKVVVNIGGGNYKSTYARPEQRRDGEALYTKMYPSQNRRTPEDDAIARHVSQERRTASQATRERAATGTTTTRRSSGSAGERTVTKSSTGQDTGTTRRSTGTAAGRTVTRTDPAQKAETTRRSTGTVTERTAPKSEPAHKAETTRRSTGNTTERAVSKPQSAPKADVSRRSAPAATQRTQSKSEPAKRAESSKTTRSSAASASKSTSRSKSSSSKKATTPSSRSSSKKEKDNEKSTRRR